MTDKIKQLPDGVPLHVIRADDDLYIDGMYQPIMSDDLKALVSELKTKTRALERAERALRIIPQKIPNASPQLREIKNTVRDIAQDALKSE